MLTNINKTTPLTDESALFYLNSILELIIKYSLPQVIIDQLALSLIQLLVPYDIKLIPTYQARLLTLIPHIKQILQSYEPTQIPLNGLLTCIKQIFTIIFEYEELHSFMIELLKAFETIVTKEWTVLVSETKEIVKGKNVLTTMGKCINGIIEWLKVNIILFNAAKSKVISIVSYYVYSQTIPMIIAQCIQFVVPIANQTTDTLLSSTENIEIDTPVNEMKNVALQLINTMMSYFYISGFATSIKKTDWYLLCGLLGKPILNTLLKICVAEYDRIEERCTHSLTSKFISRLLCFLTNMLEDYGFYDFFSENKINIMTNVVLVLIKITYYERQLINTDPQEFVSLGLDTCFKQKSHIPKTEAAKLLENLCDHIDGLLTFITNFCCEAIQCATSENFAEQLESNPMLSQYKINFLTKSTAEEIIETSLVVLADLSYLISARKDAFLVVENIMKKKIHVLFTSSVLIRCRLALMLEYYMDKLFIGNTELFEQTLEFLIKGITAEQAFAIQCAESMYSMIDDKDLIPRINDCLHKLFPYLTSMAETVEFPDFFGVLISVASNYGATIGVDIIHLLDVLVKRIIKEQEKEKKKNMLINRCWNVINSICENKELCPKYAGSIEDSILPLFNYLANPKDIEFGDDIINVIEILLGSQRKISENMTRIFAVLPKYFEKEDYVFDNLLMVLNHYLYYGRSHFIQNKQWIEILLVMIEKSLFATVDPVEKNNAEGALLIQMIMQNLGGGIMDPYIPNLLQLIFKRLNIIIKEYYVRIQLYNAFLCTICNNGQLTLELDTSQLDLILTAIINERDNFNTSYDRKVLAIGLSNVLICCTIPEFADKYFPKILECIVYTLKKQRVEDMKMHIKEDENDINLHVNSDSDDFDEEKKYEDKK